MSCAVYCTRCVSFPCDVELNGRLAEIYIMQDMLNIAMLLMTFKFIFAVVEVTLFGAVYPEYFRDLGTGAHGLYLIVEFP